MMLRSMFIVTFVFTAAAADLELVLLHTNDMHSRFDESDTYGNECHEDDASLGKCYGGFARVAQVVREEKQKAHDNGVSSLFVVAGDTFQGTPYYTFFQWKPVLDFINELRPDVMVGIPFSWYSRSYAGVWPSFFPMLISLPVDIEHFCFFFYKI